MPRKPVVSRTMRCTCGVLTFADLEQGRLYDEYGCIPGHYQDARKLEKALHKAFDNEHRRFVRISDIALEKHKYEMSESTFISNAELVKKEVK